MNKEDRQAQMMDYLYGEMTDQERRAYEQWLDQHPETRQEVEMLQTSRQWLGEVEDISPQPMIVQLPRKQIIELKWWYRAGIAAAFFLVCWLSNFQIRTASGGLILSFGNPKIMQTPDRESTDANDALPVETWKRLLADNQQLLERRLQGLDSSWQYRFSNLQSEQQQQWQQVKNTQTRQVQEIRKAFAEQELPRLAGLMQQLQMDQQAELQLLLVEFWNTWQETRETDLERIDYKMTNLYQNVERNQQASEARVVNYIQKLGR